MKMKKSWKFLESEVSHKSSKNLFLLKSVEKNVFIAPFINIKLDYLKSLDNFLYCVKYLGWSAIGLLPIACVMSPNGLLDTLIKKMLNVSVEMLYGNRDHFEVFSFFLKVMSQMILFGQDRFYGCSTFYKVKWEGYKGIVNFKNYNLFAFLIYAIFRANKIHFYF